MSTDLLRLSFVSTKRLFPVPCSTAYSCRRHSPAWSQIGQSSGWLMRKNSIIASRAFFTRSVSVRTTIPSATGVEHAITSFGAFSTSTRHIRQLPEMESPGCQQ